VSCASKHYLRRITNVSDIRCTQWDMLGTLKLPCVIIEFLLTSQSYYGIALMMASYHVLFISIVAHAAQFAFLTLVEEPHIQKIYNPPPPRRTRQNSDRFGQEDRPTTAHSDATFADTGPTYDIIRQPAPMHHIVGPQNFDFHRSIDVTVVLLSFYMFCLAILTPDTFAIRSLLVLNAFLWRLWYSLGLGYILDRQSKKKNWTRHFIKHGDSKESAWRQWKSLYHLSMIMCHASLAAAAWKMYSLPPDWFVGLTLLRHVLGVGLIALQMWTAMSIYDSLGEFGWFSGDFCEYSLPLNHQNAIPGQHMIRDRPPTCQSSSTAWSLPGLPQDS
jgi:phosphatidylethanolamine N-methyltransferase